MGIQFQTSILFLFGFLFVTPQVVLAKDSPCASALAATMAKSGVHSGLLSLLEDKVQATTADFRLGFIAATDGTTYFFNHIHAPLDKVFDHQAAKKMLESLSPGIVLAFGGLMIGSVDFANGRYRLKVKEVMRSMTPGLFLRSPPAPEDLGQVILGIQKAAKVDIDTSVGLNVLWPDAQNPNGTIVAYTGPDFWAISRSNLP